MAGEVRSGNLRLVSRYPVQVPCTCKLDLSRLKYISRSISTAGQSSERCSSLAATDLWTAITMPNLKQKVAWSVSDFTVLSLQVPPQPSFAQETTHYLYLRANAPRVPTEDTPRQVFLVNVPIDATDVHLRSLFADQLSGARLESVAFGSTQITRGIAAPLPTGKKRKRGQDESEQPGQEVGVLPQTWDREIHHSGGTAVVTFVDRTSAEAALKEARRVARAGGAVVWGQGVEGKVPPLGRARYFSHHRLRYPPAAELQASVDEYMAAYSAAEAAKEKQLARQRTAPDEDGFVTVVRGGRKGPAREEEARVKEEALKKREQERVKGDFYRFQTRERKKEEAKKLVTGFEEDRRRVEEMRKRRGRMRPE